MSELSHATSLIERLAAVASPVEGECPTHGKAIVLTRAGLPWHCPKCLDAAIRKRYMEIPVDQRRDHLHAIADLPARYRGQKFIGHTPEQKEVRAIAADFRNFISGESRWACLALIGKVGTGKTLLACEFGESYINKFGRSVRYVTGKGMISEIQSSYNLEGKSEEGEIERFVQYDLLILDEVDAIPSKDNASLLLTEVVNRRYSNERPMIVITNQELAKLAKYVGDRVHDRLHENAFFCSFDWPSFRKMA